MLKRTALYDTHTALGGKMVEFAGYELPVQYSGILEEHRAVRTAAGIFDVSHMGEFFFEGEGAEAALNSLLSNDIRGMTDGRVRYSLLPNERGGAVDDVLVYRMNAEKFMVVVNGANVAKDEAHVRAHLSGCGFRNESEKVSQMAVQGPASEKIMERVTEGTLPRKYYTFTEDVSVGGRRVLISRTGYTGETGFEIYCENACAAEIYAVILAAGKEYGLIPCGLGARDTLRLEAGMPLYGHELGEDIPVDEVGLDFAVKPEKGEFTGREAILAHVPECERIGVKVAGRGIVRENCDIYADGVPVGRSTSGTHSPTLGCGIAMLRIKRGAEGALTADVRGRMIPLERTGLPFVGRR